jgi:RNA polymerase-binding transcription factor DksA
LDAVDAEDFPAVAGASERVLDEVDAALARLASGTYGRCEVCGEEIAEARLDALPLTRSCDRHPELSDVEPTAS